MAEAERKKSLCTFSHSPITPAIWIWQIYASFNWKLAKLLNKIKMAVGDMSLKLNSQTPMTKSRTWSEVSDNLFLCYKSPQGQQYFNRKQTTEMADIISSTIAHNRSFEYYLCLSNVSTCTLFLYVERVSLKSFLTFRICFYFNCS